jgi:hypothetical protein
MFLLFFYLCSLLLKKLVSWSCVKTPKSQCKTTFALGTSFSSHVISSSLEVIHPNPSMAGLRLAVQTEEKKSPRDRVLHIAHPLSLAPVRPLHVFLGPRCQASSAKSVFNSSAMVLGTRTTSRRIKFLRI